MTPRVETCSWLTYYFYKVVFLMVVNLLLFILQHNRLQKANVKERVQQYLYSLYRPSWHVLG
jgi:hypothetical protein